VKFSVAGALRHHSDKTEVTRRQLANGGGSLVVHAHNMNRNMKNRYRVFRRGWAPTTAKTSLPRADHPQDRDKDEAYRLVAAQNENEDAPAFSLHWHASIGSGRSHRRPTTWQHVMDEIPKLKTGETQHRWLTAIKDKAFASLRNLVVLETQAEHFFESVGRNGSISTNIYLRRIHNSP